MNRCARLLALILVLSAPSVRAQTELLDQLSDRLRWSTANGLFQTQLSGLFDLEGYWIDQHPPGLIFGGSSDFPNPRLWLFLDTRLGNHLYSFVEVRADRGFDPRVRGLLHGSTSTCFAIRRLTTRG